MLPTGPSGVGSYGEGPPPPDSSRPPPECNIVSDGPCYDKCEAEDEARAIECAKIQDEAQRKACVESSYEKYKSCREACEQNSNSTCLAKWEWCTDYAPWSCAKPIKKLTKCRECYRQCESGNPTSPDCRECGF